MLDRYFPLGLAEGESFLNRKDEIARLKSNIAQGYHTLLLAPRRYGKTSLAKHVINMLHYPWVEIDLFVAQNELSIEQKFLKGIQSIIGHIDTPEKWFQTLMNYFKKANKTWSVGVRGIKLEIIPEHHHDIPENILEALNALEFVLNKKKQRAVLFIDEFQEIANIKIAQAIEGAIRHFAQASRRVVFIFSGSSQHMLKHMFGDKSRPLFALCHEISLARLPPKHYKTYLNKVAHKTWKTALHEEVFARIMAYTECHPKYVYNLCIYLWEYCESFKNGPRVQDVDTIWNNMVQDKIKDTREILNARSTGQIKILAFIALNLTKELTGQLAQSKLGMSGSAITQALRLLEADDYLERLTDGSLRIIDPLLKTTLLEYSTDYFV
jgi:predicted AAA+ superfamily ATPase